MKKQLINLGYITDNNTVRVSKIGANILQQFENKFLLLQICHKSKIQLHSHGNPALLHNFVPSQWTPALFFHPHGNTTTLASLLVGFPWIPWDFHDTHPQLGLYLLRHHTNSVFRVLQQAWSKF